MIKKFWTLSAECLAAIVLFVDVLTGEVSDKVFPRREITDG